MTQLGHSLFLPDIAATRSLGRQLGELCGPGDIFYLDGPLGAGKTSFVQGLAAGLGVSARVLSPTFTLVNEYPGGRLPMSHWDLYRLPVPADVAELGWDDYRRTGGVIALEWAERLGEARPDPGLVMDFRYTDDGGRVVSLLLPDEGWVQRYEGLLAELEHRGSVC